MRHGKPLMWLSLLLVALVLAGCSFGGGTKTGDVDVEIFYMDGETKVSIDDRSVEVTIGSTSKSSSIGFVAFTGVSAGNQTVMAEAVGFEDYEGNVLVEENQVYSYGLEMTPLASGNISGTAYYPEDVGVGSLQLAGRVPAANCLVYVYEYPYTEFSEIVAQGETDGTGNFVISGLPVAKDYVVVVNVPAQSLVLKALVPEFSGEDDLNVDELSTLASGVYQNEVPNGSALRSDYQALLDTIRDDHQPGTVDVRPGNGWFDQNGQPDMGNEQIANYRLMAGDTLHQSVEQFVDDFINAHSTLGPMFLQHIEEYQSLLYYDMDTDTLSGNWAQYMTALVPQLAFSMEQLVLGTIFEEIWKNDETYAGGRYQVVEDEFGWPMLDEVDIYTRDVLASDQWLWEVFMPAADDGSGFWVVYDFRDTIGMMGEIIGRNEVPQFQAQALDDFVFDFTLTDGTVNDDPTDGNILAHGQLAVGIVGTFEEMEVVDVSVNAHFLVGTTFATDLAADVNIQFSNMEITSFVLSNASVDSPILEGSGSIIVEDIEYIEAFSVLIDEEDEGFFVPFYPGRVVMEDEWIFYLLDGESRDGKLAETNGTLEMAMVFNDNLQSPVPKSVDFAGAYYFYGGAVTAQTIVTGDLAFLWATAETYAFPDDPNMTASLSGSISGRAEDDSSVEFELSLEFTWNQLERPYLTVEYTYPDGGVSGMISSVWQLVDTFEGQDLEFARADVQLTNSDNSLTMILRFQDGVSGRITNQAGVKLAEIIDGTVILRNGQVLSAF